jgi:uncharacterized membrane protein
MINISQKNQEISILIIKKSWSKVKTFFLVTEILPEERLTKMKSKGQLNKHKTRTRQQKIQTRSMNHTQYDK